MFWCFHCYAVNDHPSGPCDACGQRVEAPIGLSYVGGLIWALRHPDGDRAVVAARTLGRLKSRESARALREAARAGADIYLRSEALRSLITIGGRRRCAPPCWRNWPVTPGSTCGILPEGH
jgi:glucose/arabinose dehydrogenase